MVDGLSLVDQYMLFCFVWCLLHKNEVVRDFLNPDNDNLVRDFLLKEVSSNGSEC